MPAVLRPLFLLAAIGWAVVLYYLSAQPGIDVQPLFAGQDKVFHAGAYSVLGFLILGAIKPAGHAHSQGQILLAAGLAAGYGLFDEFHQYFVPGRSADTFDVIADAAGGMLGVLLMVAITRRLPARHGDDAPG
jgi:VanZ family protein